MKGQHIQEFLSKLDHNCKVHKIFKCNREPSHTPKCQLKITLGGEQLHQS